MEPSDIVERLDQVANDIVDALGTLIGGPFSTRDDAVRYVTDHLRATYVAEITRLRAALAAERADKCDHDLAIYRIADGGIQGKCKKCGETVTVYQTTL